MDRLERGERPSVNRAKMRTLAREEIGSLLTAADQSPRVLLAAAVFTGLRLDELLGLTWYAHLFDAAEHAQRASAGLEASFGGMLGGNQVESGPVDHQQGADNGQGSNVTRLPHAATADE